jgi:hypothetical protein
MLSGVYKLRIAVVPIASVHYRVIHDPTWGLYKLNLRLYKNKINE